MRTIYHKRSLLATDVDAYYQACPVEKNALRSEAQSHALQLPSPQAVHHHFGTGAIS